MLYGAGYSWESFRLPFPARALSRDECPAEEDRTPWDPGNAVESALDVAPEAVVEIVLAGH